MKHHAILYYISSHGYGHASRAGKVIHELVKNNTVYIKTLAPKWLLKQIIGSEPLIIGPSPDTGCLQRNNFDVDIDGTMDAYLKQSEINKLSMESERSFIQEKNIEAIISDIPSFPFLIAKKTSLPSVFIGNFTWKGIYSFYLKNEGHPIIQELAEQYGLADKSLTTPLSMDMPELKDRKKISFIARKGANIRERLNRDFKIPEENKLVFFYAGNHGAGNIPSGLVGKIEGHTFISFYPLDSPPDNFICLESDIYAHQDIMASSDCALIKPGYGMVSEAMVNNIPIIYPPREDFAEYFAFVQEFENSRGALLIKREDFDTGNWMGALSSIKGLKYRKNYSSNGAIECARVIESLLS